MRSVLLLICLVVMGAGVLWPAVAYLPFDPLPGDFSINTDSFRLYIPLTTCISASVVLTLLFWYMRK